MIGTGLVRMAQLALTRVFALPLALFRFGAVTRGSRTVIQLRSHALVFAVALSPVFLTIYTCDRGDTYIATLEVEVAGQNQISDFDINNRSYAVTLNSSTAILRVKTRMITSTASYQWIVGGTTIEAGDIPPDDPNDPVDWTGTVPINVPVGQSVLRINVRSMEGTVDGYTVDVTNVTNDPPPETTTIPIVCHSQLGWFGTELTTTIDAGAPVAGLPLSATSYNTTMVLTAEMFQAWEWHGWNYGYGGPGTPTTQLAPGFEVMAVHTASGTTAEFRYEFAPATIQTPFVQDFDGDPGGQPCMSHFDCPKGGGAGQTCTDGFCDPLDLCGFAPGCPWIYTGGDQVIPFEPAVLTAVPFGGPNVVGGVGEQVCFDLDLAAFFGLSCQPGTVVPDPNDSIPPVPNPISDPPLFCIDVEPDCALASECPLPAAQCEMPACVNGACTSAAVPDFPVTQCDFGGLPGLCMSGVCEDAMLCLGVDCDDGDPCSEDLCDPQDGSCFHNVVPLGGCHYVFDLYQSLFRHHSNASSPKPVECGTPDLSMNPGANLGGIEDRCFRETTTNTGTLFFRDLGGGNWEVFGNDTWAFANQTATVVIDSTVDFSGTGTGTIEDGGQIILDPLTAGFNINASETGTLECTGACFFIGYPPGLVSLPLAGDPGMRTLPVIGFGGDPLEVMLGSGPSDATGWYLRNPAPMANDGTEWGALKGDFVGMFLNFCEGVDCDDLNQCTADSCDPSDGSCNNVAVSDGTSCDFGGNPGACISGTCEAWCDWKNCGDSNECTADSCDPAAGACVNTPEPNGASCLGGKTSCFDGVCQGKTISLACTNTLSNDTHIMDMNLIVEPLGEITELVDGTPFDAGVRGEVIFPQYILDELDVILAAEISDLLITVQLVFGGGPPTTTLTVQQPSATCSEDGNVSCDPINDNPPGSGMNPACDDTFEDRCGLWFRNVVSTDCSPGGTCETIGKADQCTAFNRCVTGPVVFPLAPVFVANLTPFHPEIRFDIAVGAVGLNPDGTYQLPPADPDPLLNGPNYAIGTAPEGTATVNCIMAVDSDGPDGVGVPGGASPSPPEADLVLPVRP